MHYLDWIILSVAAYGFYRGFRKGLVHIVLSLAGLVMAVFLASRFSGQWVPFLSEKLNSSPDKIMWLAYAVVFFGTLIAVALLTKLLDKIISSAGLGWVNKMTGGFLSALKSLLIIGLFFKLIASVQERFMIFPKDFEKDSKYYAPLIQVTDTLIHHAGNWHRKWKQKHPSVNSQDDLQNKNDTLQNGMNK